jgi:glycerophosphoryl diester phosphodiesterase
VVPPDLTRAELVAHRGANTVEALRAAELVADLVELDVHLRRGRLEVRHAKVLWPTSRLWERWYLLPRGAPVPTLQEIVEALDPATHVLVDLKGIRPRATAAVAAALAGRRPLTVSAKLAWMLRPWHGRAGVRTIRSAGNRLELLLLCRLPPRRRVDGYAVRANLLDEQLAHRLRQRSDTLLAWGVDNRVAAGRLTGWGVSGLIVDDLRLVAELRTVRPR